MHRSSSPYDSLEARNSQGLRLIEMFLRQIGVFIGLGLLGFIIFCVLALATWNVADPSLTHANTNEVTNLMGWLGAIFSDLIMQFFGLAGLAVLLPPLFWSFLLLAQKNIYNLTFRIFLWGLSTICFASAFALMTPVASFTYWPLPMGLGGVLGDKALSIAALIFPFFLSPLYTVCFSVIFIFLGFFIAAFAGNVIWRRKTKKRKEKSIPKNEIVDLIFEVEKNTEHVVEDDRVQYSFFATTLGAILHLFYFLQARFFRLFCFKRHSQSRKQEKSFDRIEPIFEGEKEKDEENTK